MKKKELTLVLAALIPLLGAVNRSQAADSPPQPLADEKPAIVAAPIVEPDAASINCQYRLPSEVKTPSQTLLANWAKKAAVQSFQFNPATLDTELTELKKCYTDLGFKGFNDALEKSGNLAAIKSKQLTVNSIVQGDATVEVKKDNQWRVKLPLNVTYENKDQKLVQSLNVELLITRKPSGELGIIQVIATPHVKVDEAIKK